MTKQADKEEAAGAAKDKPQGFKIGDLGRPGMTAPKAPVNPRKKDDLQPESYSLGFARIEGILEREDPVTVGASLNKLLQDLEAWQQSRSSNKDKLAAKKAMAAVERAVDLMDYLYQTKEALEAEAKGG